MPWPAVVAVQAALPGLVATGGRVAWTGGGVALSPSGEYGVLALGKAAMRAAGFALAQELAPLGVTLRMLTIKGFIRPGGRFDPDRIARGLLGLRPGARRRRRAALRRTVLMARRPCVRFRRTSCAG